MPDQEKVYCLYCKHTRQVHPWEPGELWTCAANPKSTAVYPGGEGYDWCTHVNRKNDCKKFERKLTILQRIKRWLLKKN